MTRAARVVGGGRFVAARLHEAEVGVGLQASARASASGGGSGHGGGATRWQTEVRVRSQPPLVKPHAFVGGRASAPPFLWRLGVS